MFYKTKTEEIRFFACALTLKGNEPLVSAGDRLLTVQVQNGHSTHQLLMLVPFEFPPLARGDQLEISLTRKRTTKTWLGRFLERYR